VLNVLNHIISVLQKLEASELQLIENHLKKKPGIPLDRPEQWVPLLQVEYLPAFLFALGQNSPTFWLSFCHSDCKQMYSAFSWSLFLLLFCLQFRISDAKSWSFKAIKCICWLGSAWTLWGKSLQLPHCILIGSERGTPIPFLSPLMLSASWCQQRWRLAHRISVSYAPTPYGRGHKVMMMHDWRLCDVWRLLDVWCLSVCRVHRA